MFYDEKEPDIPRNTLNTYAGETLREMHAAKELKVEDEEAVKSGRIPATVYRLVG